MGQRGKTAAFMPEKYVFPGGAVDEADLTLPLSGNLEPACNERLAQRSDRPPAALAAAAIRELWEETGLRLGRRKAWDAPKGWESFAEGGVAPNASALRFFFRAITPPGRPRRFDARFFLADADALSDDPDDFSRAEDELRHLHWVTLSDVRALDLPFVTRIVLGELATHLPRLDAPDRVAFVTNDVIDHAVIWL